MQQHVELHNYGVDKEGVSKSGKAVIFEESHKEAEANQHHNIDVLEGRVSLACQGIST